jgi:hypothetical protein
VGKCDTILAELDVEYKEKKERDGRMDRLESSLNTLRDEVSSLLTTLKNRL